jgi:phosphatidylglycerophosphate synthase
MENNLNRRPLKAREWNFIQLTARKLAQTNIHPNQISLMSIVFSGLAAFSLLLTNGASGLWLFITSWMVIIFILGRGACNIFDGMVAVEGGKKTASGELFNDIPDRISDALLFIGAGYAINVVSWGPEAGWCAALLAVMTAYIRALGRGLGAGSDFQGPMGKTQRMAVLAFACFLMPFVGDFFNPQYLLLTALIIVSMGCVITSYKRAKRAYEILEG